MTVTFEQKRADVVAASSMMMKKVKLFLVGCWLVIAAMDVPGFYRDLRSDGFFAMLREEGIAIFTLILLGLFFLFLTWLQPRLAARKAILRTVEWRFSDAGVHLQSDVASSDILWKAFIRFREGPKVLLLYTQKGQANFIPKRALDASQLDELRRLIHAHVPERK
jgi:hypothetical protein